jgi:diguanylate cyclase
VADTKLPQLADEHATAALESMRRFNIPLRPSTFTVWFDYHDGGNLDLKREIDAAIAKGQAFTEVACAALYARFIDSGDDAAVRETTRRVQAILDQAMGITNRAQEKTRHHGESLQAIGDRMRPDGAVAEIAELIRRALAETRAIERHNLELSDRLRSSSQEIGFLRRRLETVRHEALTDSLTGLANRKALDASLREAAEQAREAGQPLSVVLLDIDHFKAFNDKWGHQFGDQVLQLVAEVIVANVRGQDLVARYGGEEFAVVLPQTDLVGAAAVANNVRKALSAQQIVNKRSQIKMGRVTLSAGVAGVKAGEAPAVAVRRADRALYAAKHAGRNRVVDETEITADA